MLLRFLSHRLIDVPTASCHASTVLPVGGGDVLIAYFGGSREGADDVGIYLAERRGGVMTAPRLVADAPLPHWNPVLFTGGDGTIFLYYKVGRRIPSWRTFVISSRDGGRTFSEPKELVPGDDSGGRGPVRNHILRLQSGRLLAPGSCETGLWRCFADISDDGGRKWRRSDWIVAEGTAHLDEGIRFWQAEREKAWAAGIPFEEGRVPKEYAHGRGVIQPAFWADEQGVHALMRSGEGFIYRADSADGGETWTEAYPTLLPNNNSGIDLTRLPGGELLLAMNPVSGNFANRYPLSLQCSKDGGETWERLCDPEAGEGEYSYPSLACDGNRVYLTYTWRREKIAFWEFAYERQELL